MNRRWMIGSFGASVLVAGQGGAMTCQPLSPEWEYVADTVMGGVSTGRIIPFRDAGEPAMRLTGNVSLENNGGFIQMASDLSDPGQVFDASGYTALSFDARGNGESYAISLRTSDLQRPWQSYRAVFTATEQWQKINLPFDAFSPNNTEIPLNTRRLRRIGIIAVGRAFEADVAVKSICFHV